MNWQQVTAMPELQNLPFKIELDEKGRMIMSAAHRIGHSVYQGKIEFQLQLQKTFGEVFPECAIVTRKGTKVADVVWASDFTFTKIRDEVAATVAPEICVEVLSISNSDDEMSEKRELYFECGAKEVWICDEYGKISFYDASGKIANSQLFPLFPNNIGLN